MAEGGCTDFSDSEQQSLNMETEELVNPELESTNVVEPAEGAGDKDLQLSAFLEKAKTYVIIFYPKLIVHFNCEINVNIDSLIKPCNMTDRYFFQQKIMNFQSEVKWCYDKKKGGLFKKGYLFYLWLELICYSLF